MNRNIAVQMYKDRLTLKRMMSALSADLKDYNREKSSETNSNIINLKSRLIYLRQAARHKVDDLQSPRSLAGRETDRIKERLVNFAYGRKFDITATVTNKGPYGEYEKPWRTGANPTIKLNVGVMWYRSVYENIYKNQGFVKEHDLIVLQAVEYRTNVPNIRIYSAIVYSIPEKTHMSGWIGQAKLGGKSTFRMDRSAALKAAQQLTVKSVNKHIKGEN
jgi:hypothetical protein